MRRRLREEEPLVIPVLQPATLGNDREVAAELPGQGREPLSQVVHRERRVAFVDLRVHDLPAARVPIRIRPLLGRTRLVHGQLRGDRQRDLLPREQMSHQLAARPSVGAGDRDAELFVGQVRERLERPEGVTLLVEEFECVEIHALHGSRRDRPPRRRW